MTIGMPPPADPTPSKPGVPAGWYPDPSNGAQRWWDGAVWTNTFAAAPAVTAVGPKRRNIWATISFVTGLLGVVGIITTVPWLALFGGLVALLAGIDGIVQARRGAAAMALAIWGLVLGAVVLLVIGGVLLIAR